MIFKFNHESFKGNCLPLDSDVDFFEKMAEIANKENEVICKDESGKKYVWTIDHNRKALRGLSDWLQIIDSKTINDFTLEIIGNSLFVKSLNKKISSKKELLIGKEKGLIKGFVSDGYTDDYYLSKKDLPLHMYICGGTGSGKTVLGKIILEESAKKGIPSIVIDLKGDLSSHAMTLDPKYSEKYLKFFAGDDDKVKSKNAKKETKVWIKELKKWEYSKFLKQNLNKIKFRIFTVGNNKGIQISLANSLTKPENPEIINEILDSCTSSLCKKLYPRQNEDKIKNERNFLFELIKYCWNENIDLEGIKGIENLIGLIEKPPFSHIGVIPVGEYIPLIKNTTLRNNLNSLIAGSYKKWYEGETLDIESLLKKYQNKTPINIINLQGNDPSEQGVIVSDIANSILKWMFKQKGTNEPKLIFFIDEIGGGGGGQALFPSVQKNPAKPSLNALLRQGRAFDVCCIFATQNPGDIDYKALTNCHTHFIGKLSTDRDRGKAFEGFKGSRLTEKEFEKIVVGIKSKNFLTKSKDGEVSLVFTRPIPSIHRVIIPEEIKGINEYNKAEESLVID